MVEWLTSVTWDEWLGLACLLALAAIVGSLKHRLDVGHERERHGKAT